MTRKLIGIFFRLKTKDNKFLLFKIEAKHILHLSIENVSKSLCLTSENYLSEIKMCDSFHITIDKEANRTLKTGITLFEQILTNKNLYEIWLCDTDGEIFSQCRMPRKSFLSDSDNPYQISKFNNSILDIIIEKPTP